MTTVANADDERRGRRVESVGFILLFPALILGIFSANTNTPGAGTWSGFGAMILVMVALTLAAYRYLLRR
jgi:Mg2+ and Co2+ transporter CorA